MTSIFLKIRRSSPQADEGGQTFDDTVTVRNRDTTEQIRQKIAEISF